MGFFWSRCLPTYLSIYLSIYQWRWGALGPSGFTMARVTSLDAIDKVYIKSRSGMGPAGGG